MCWHNKIPNPLGEKTNKNLNTPNICYTDKLKKEKENARAKSHPQTTSMNDHNWGRIFHLKLPTRIPDKTC